MYIGRGRATCRDVLLLFFLGGGGMRRGSGNRAKLPSLAIGMLGWKTVPEAGVFFVHCECFFLGGCLPVASCVRCTGGVCVCVLWWEAGHEEEDKEKKCIGVEKHSYSVEKKTRTICVGGTGFCIVWVGAAPFVVTPRLDRHVVRQAPTLLPA